MTEARNLVIIMSDEHDPRFMGCMGHPRVQTPNLDALAARGMNFRSAYTPSSICVPARAAFATGRRVHQIRHWDNAMPYYGAEQGWGHRLQAHGVRVESIGKLHYRAEEDPAGFDREILPMHVVGGHGMVWASIRDPYVVKSNPRSRMLGEKIGAGESSYTQYDARVTEAAEAWLAAAGRDRPFVLFVGLVAPHFPLVVPQRFFDLYPPDEMPEPKFGIRSDYVRHPWVQQYFEFSRVEDAFADEAERRAAFSAYHGLCTWMDENVGRICAALEAAGLADSTRVIYTSDHGENLGVRGLWGKSNCYEESVRVPMIVAGPGVRAGVCDTPVDLLDLYPTILASMGVDADPDDTPRPGRSLFEIAKEPDDPSRPVFSEYHAAGSNTGAFMWRQHGFKLIEYVRHAPELFDLVNDPEETRDLAADPAHAPMLARLRAALRAEVGEPEDLDRMAKDDQRAMIERLGGTEVAMKMGARGATPVPDEAMR